MMSHIYLLLIAGTELIHLNKEKHQLPVSVHNDNLEREKNIITTTTSTCFILSFKNLCNYNSWLSYMTPLSSWPTNAT